MRLTIKRGVSLAGIQPQIAIGCLVVLPILEDYSQVGRLTSGTERAAGRVRRSLHIVGAGADFGCHGLSPALRVELQAELGDALGDEWDVIVYADWVHIEFQPEVHR